MIAPNCNEISDRREPKLKRNGRRCHPSEWQLGIGWKPFEATAVYRIFQNSGPTISDEYRIDMNWMMDHI